MSEEKDNWKHRSANMVCGTCMYFVPKMVIDKASGNPRSADLGRCRRNAPIMKGWPAVFDSDWCGDHKLDEEKIGAE
jgi:hypothetical protein